MPKRITIILTLALALFFGASTANAVPVVVEFPIFDADLTGAGFNPAAVGIGGSLTPDVSQFPAALSGAERSILVNSFGPVVGSGPKTQEVTLSIENLTNQALLNTILVFTRIDPDTVTGGVGIEDDLSNGGFITNETAAFFTAPGDYFPFILFGDIAALGTSDPVTIKFLWSSGSFPFFFNVTLANGNFPVEPPDVPEPTPLVLLVIALIGFGATLHWRTR